MDERIRYQNFVYDSARWDGFQLRPGDIVISTAPKCGTTWLQRICSLLVFETDELIEPLARTSPWLEMRTTPKAEVFRSYVTQAHRRFIKSHTPFDGLPYDPRVTYVSVARDPRDVALSWDSHQANADFAALNAARAAALASDGTDAPAMAEPPPAGTAEQRFWQWVEDPTPVTESLPTLAFVLHHLASFWDARDRANVVLLHYQALREDLEGQMRGLAKALGISIAEAQWPRLVAAAGFERMKRDADLLVPEVHLGIWLHNSDFFHRGTSGQWRAMLRDPASRQRYAARARSLAAPDVLAWAHGQAL